METSFFEGQYVLVDKLTYHFHSPQRGDVIVFHKPNKKPNEPSELYIKRIIGLPGEQVEIREGRVYITKDGEQQVLEESEYIPLITIYQMSPLTVPDGEYFVLGDNRNSSSDSHGGWTVPRESIIGKVWLCYWPPSEWGLSPEYSAALE